MHLNLQFLPELSIGQYELDALQYTIILQCIFFMTLFGSKKVSQNQEIKTVASFESKIDC